MSYSGETGRTEMPRCEGAGIVTPSEFESHLSRIETHWTAVMCAHRGPADEAAEARSLLLERYRGAVRRYLLASLRDVEAADDLAQELVLRFLRGDFRNADPGGAGSATSSSAPSII
jgi:Sigma-70 region 2